MHWMIVTFIEIGRVREVVETLIEMYNQGLSPTAQTLNWVTKVLTQMGLLEIGSVLDADRWLGAIVERGYVVDNATLTLLINIVTTTWVSLVVRTVPATTCPSCPAAHRKAYNNIHDILTKVVTIEDNLFVTYFG
ncbi:hypothetical protein Fmac_025136 [Flemingia macrophylla]|uniref:Pentatricopeptide repeat-containing protein n=1 Tax=Flemingia macrophylla TaxID=520843 RepID=A0ABD1LRG6_9FABA